MSLSILRDTVESIKNAGFHTIMVDERSDISNKEQAVLCVRWVDQNLFSYEDFLGLYQMEKTDAVSIAIFIKGIILRMSFDSEKLQGQCYDDCATMMGKKKGVDTQIKNDISKKNNLLHYLPIATHTM